ncbi:MAG: lysozyme family protein, partial [Clostridia bacterium]|nr:lysozyme family protein [Clostridia bacterium]
MHSFLLIGQSNMAGRGMREEEVWVDTTHIKTLRNGRWQRMFRPINPDRYTAGANLAESFAEKYAEKYGIAHFVDVRNAVMMAESGGRIPDVMQASE